MPAIRQGDAQGGPVLVRQAFLGIAGIPHEAAQDVVIGLVANSGLEHDPLRQEQVHVIAP